MNVKRWYALSPVSSMSTLFSFILVIPGGGFGESTLLERLGARGVKQILSTSTISEGSGWLLPTP